MFVFVKIWMWTEIARCIPLSCVQHRTLLVLSGQVLLFEFRNSHGGQVSKICWERMLYCMLREIWKLCSLFRRGFMKVLEQVINVWENKLLLLLLTTAIALNCTSLILSRKNRQSKLPQHKICDSSHRTVEKGFQCIPTAINQHFLLLDFPQFEWTLLLVMPKEICFFLFSDNFENPWQSSSYVVE